MIRYLLIILLTTIFLAACKSKNGTSMDLQEANIAIAQQVYVHFNRHDWSAMADLYTNPAEFKDPSFGQDMVKQSKQQIISKYHEMAQLFPDLRDDIVQVYPSGDKHVIVEFISSGTAPDGTKWTLPICTIFTIENGKIIKDFTYYDNPPEE
jgi:ketosteroid isomerase-like protein